MKLFNQSLFVIVACGCIGIVAGQETLTAQVLLKMDENPRIMEARAIEDPGKRLATLAALADELTRKQAHNAGLTDPTGAARLGVSARAIGNHSVRVRSALLAREDETFRRAAAQVAAARKQRPAFSQAEHLKSLRATLEYAENVIRNAGHSTVDEARLLAIVQRQFSPSDQDDVVRTHAELNPEPIEEE